MSGRKGRRRVLSPGEEALWRLVTKSVEPLAPVRRPAEPEPSPAPPAEMPASPEGIAPPPGVAPAPQPKRPKPLAPIQSREIKRLARQPFAETARLDLHGMTQDAAHRRLVGFLTSAQRGGVKLVLVITGKGDDRDGHDPLAHGRGVLRRVVPAWLAAPELRAIVLGFSAARPEHGGGGALYVRLRRPG